MALLAPKNVIVSWLLNFGVHVLLNSAVTFANIFSFFLAFDSNSLKLTAGFQVLSSCVYWPIKFVFVVVVVISWRRRLLPALKQKMVTQVHQC